MTTPAVGDARLDLAARCLEIVRAHASEADYRRSVATHRAYGGADEADGGAAALLWVLNKAVDDPRIRQAIAASLAAQHRILAPGSTGAPAADVETLRSEGVLFLGNLLAAGEIADVRRHLQACTVANHDTTLLNYEIADVVRAPHLLRVALDPRVLAAVSAYMEMPATIVDISAWTSEPGGSAPEGPQIFHRDRDDFRACKLFMYLTDVGADDGPHIFVRHSHDFAWILGQFDGPPGGEANVAGALSLFSGNGRHLAHHIEGLFGDKVIEITGPAGASFLELTYGFHRGKQPTAKARQVYQVMYGMTPFANRTERLSAARLGALPPEIADTPSVRQALRFFHA